MLDPKLLRAELETVAQQLAARGLQLDTKKIDALEKQRKALQTETQELQNIRNSRSKTLGEYKAKGQDISEFLKELAETGEKLAIKEQELQGILQELQDLYLAIPNIPHSSVPAGLSEEDNREERRWGTIKKFDFSPRDHVSLGEQWGYMDFTAGAKLAGSRFVVLQGPLARLHRALIQFMVNYHINHHGYQEIYVPYLVNKESLLGTGQLPKFYDDQFRTQAEPEYFLIPTAEVPVTNMARDKIFENDQLPVKYVCHTPCFRKEAGSYGKDTRGMIRQHQFEKVELVQMVPPNQSYQKLEELTSHAEAILQQLQLPYRVVSLCTGDLGFSAAKTYDLEVWLPGQNKYREISSCSNFESFQARRMQARWRNPITSKIEYLHTLNGSGLAIGRTLVAIMENYQDEQGRIHVPEVLYPYMGDVKIIAGPH